MRKLLDNLRNTSVLLGFKRKNSPVPLGRKTKSLTKERKSVALLNAWFGKTGQLLYDISTNCLQNTFYTFPACKEEGGRWMNGE